MPRFKRYRRVASHRAAWAFGVRTIQQAAKARRLTEDVERRWVWLQGHCRDQGSRSRLERLVTRLGSRDRGVQESALAELELATLLLRAGARVGFLPESQARSADLECQVEGDRFFVEVTAMVGTMERSLRLGERSTREESDTDEGPATPEQIFREAVLARIAQKAKQLADYCAPVVLAISVPRLEEEVAGSRWGNRVELDVKHLAGSISLLLPKLRHISGVLLALWDVEPLPAISAVRLANVAIAERSRQQAAYPRLRMFVQNPAATARLTIAQQDMFRGLL